MGARQIRRGGFALAVCLALGSAIARAAPAPRLPVEAFARLPVISGPQLSPGGRYVGALMTDAGQRYVAVVFDLQRLGQQTPLKLVADDWDVGWVRWKTEERLIFGARNTQFDGREAITQTRLLAVNADGSQLRRLIQLPPHPLGGSRGFVQFADEVVDRQPHDPDHILVSFNSEGGGLQLYRLNVGTDRRQKLEPGYPWIQTWMLDRQGRVRVAQGRDLLAGEPYSVKTYHRAEKDGRWQRIWDEEERDARFFPIVFDGSDQDVIQVVSDHEAGRLGLYRYRLSSGEFIERRYLHPEVDLYAVILDDVSGEIDGVSYITDVLRYEWFNQDMAEIFRELQAQLPGWTVRFVSRTDDKSKVMVFASAADHAGRYLLYEPRTKSLRLFANQFPELDEYDMGRVTPVRYKARDGMAIPAYLTLPRDARNPPAQPLPAVVLLNHSASRSQADFDPVAQLLANRGYAVLQVNHRGSAGYGAAFRKAGERAWGEAIQDDITEGTRWLVQSKIADPQRICVVGWHFGGYAALMGAIREPALYRCVASFNGVSNLRDFMDTNRWFVDGYTTSVRMLGDPWADRAKLEAISPARRAADIRAPVLLVYSAESGSVRLSQTEYMADALKKAGKDYRDVLLKNQDNWRRTNSSRLQSLQELDTFLATHLR